MTDLTTSPVAHRHPLLTLSLPLYLSAHPSSEQQIAAYLFRIQRDGHIQPFGCTLFIADSSSFRLLAFSENATDLLDLSPHHSILSLDSSAAPPPISLGADARLLFSPSSVILLERAFAAREISLLNPLWIHSRVSSRPFYTILHHIDVSVVIDLELAHTEDPALSITGAVQSQKLAVRAISRLQAIPGGDVKLLYATIIEHVRELTGYDSVMVYKFQDDKHGDVVALSRSGGPWRHCGGCWGMAR